MPAVAARWAPGPVAAIAVALLFGLALAGCTGDNPATTEPRARSGSDESPSPSKKSGKQKRSPAPRIEHAPWRIGVFAIGGKKGGDKHRLLTQRPRLRRTLKAIYDALWLARDGSKRAIFGRFVRPAARELLRSRAGLPAETSEVHLVRRSAQVGLLTAAGRRAAARVSIRARGKLHKKRFDIVQRSRLWLERSGTGWTVIAYEVLREPGP